jgi:integrase
MSITIAKCHEATPGTKPQKLAAGDGLYLLVSVAGSKTWKWGYRLPDPVKGRMAQYEATLGTFPDMDPKKARTAAAKAAEFVQRGEHPPKLQKPKALPPSTGAVALHLSVWGAASSWLKLRTPEWSPSYARQVETYLTAYVGPDTELGKKSYAAVERPELFELIECIGQTAPSVARLVKQWLTGVFDRLVDKGLLKYSPLAGMKTKNAVPTTKTDNSPVLQPPALAALLVRIRAYRERRMGILLELLAHTCVRSSELRCADWSEFDLDAARWIVPAYRMKMRTLHVVPLSPQAVALLRELQTECDGATGLLFAHTYNSNEPMVQSAPREALYRLSKKEFHPHGFRSTFSTIAHESGKAPHLIEAALAHQQRNRTAAAYNKSTYIEERRGLMAWWSDELDKLIDSHSFDKQPIAA